MPRVTQLAHTEPGLEFKCPGSLLPKPAHDTRLPPRSDVTVPAIMASEEWKVRPLFHGQCGSQIRKRCSKHGCVHPRQGCWTCRTDLFIFNPNGLLDRGSKVPDRQKVPFPQSPPRAGPALQNTQVFWWESRGSQPLEGILNL